MLLTLIACASLPTGVNPAQHPSVEGHHHPAPSSYQETSTPTSSNKSTPKGSKVSGAGALLAMTVHTGEELLFATSECTLALFIWQYNQESFSRVLPTEQDHTTPSLYETFKSV